MARVAFVNGGRDGTFGEVPDPPPPELRLPANRIDDQSQVYQLEHDGKYHFVGYSHPLSNGLSATTQRAIAELVEPLQRLTAACVDDNGYPPLIEIGDWQITPRMLHGR